MRFPTTADKDSIPAAVRERLERDKRQWEQWRQKRRKGAPIPERLWQIALSYVGHFSLHRISREFRVEYNKLKRLSTRPASLPKEPPPGMPQFLDVTAWLPTGDRRSLSAERPYPASTVVLERPDGHRLRLEGLLPEVSYLEALVGIFLRARP